MVSVARRLIVVLFLCVLVSEGVSIAASSGSSGLNGDGPSFYGTVYERDDSGQVVPLLGAAVRVLNVFRDEILHRTPTDSDGRFSLPTQGWPDGTYIVTADKDWHRPYFGAATIRGGSGIPFVAVLDYDPAPVGVKNYPVEGIILASWWNGEYQTSESDQSLLKLMRTGADHVGLLATWYMDTANGEYSTSNTIYADPQKSPSDADLAHAIAYAKNHGRKVMLKLHVRVVLNRDPWEDKWAGRITPSSPAAWFTSYTQFAVHYAQLARDHGVDILCFGTELTSMTTPAHEAQWDAVIDAIRATGYAGKLTFSADMFQEYQQITFWDRCDYLGIGPYWSLTGEVADPDLDEIINGWFSSPVDGPIIGKLADWSAGNGDKQVLFTEIGYCSVDTAPWEPWKGTQTRSENWPLQKRCYDALFLALQGEPWFAGMFWWDWLTDPSTPTTPLERKDYTPQNKPAEDSLRNFFLGTNPDDVDHIRIVDGDGVEAADGTTLYTCHTKNLYVLAYDGGGQVLGYSRCKWSASGQAATLDANEVGYALIEGTGEGSVTITATDINGFTDSVVIPVARRQLVVPGEYASISQAMVAAARGDAIVVAPGAYGESVSVKDGVSIIGSAGAGSTLLNGGLILSEGDNDLTVIQGTTITNAAGDGVSSSHWGGVGSPTIRQSIIRGCSGAGIRIPNCEPRIHNNIVEGNAGGGLILDGGAPEVVNNVVKGNSAAGQGGGIYILWSRGKILNNIVVGNYAATYGGGIKCWGCYPEFVLDYNDVWGNHTGTGGEDDYGTCGTPGPSSLQVEPLFADSDYHLSPSSPCVDKGNPDTGYNDPNGSRNDMGAYGGPHPL